MPLILLLNGEVKILNQIHLNPKIHVWRSHDEIPVQQAFLTASWWVALGNRVSCRGKREHRTVIPGTGAEDLSKDDCDNCDRLDVGG